MKIRDIVKESVVINENETFHDAVELMVRKQTNSLLVVNDEGTLVGEVNVSDLLDAIVPEDLNGDNVLEQFAAEETFHDAVRNASEKSVQEFMNVEIQPIHVDDSLITIAATAIAYQTAHIPIVDHDERPLGFVSRRGLKHIIAKYLNIKE